MKIAISVIVTLVYTVGWPVFIFTCLYRLHKKPSKGAGNISEATPLNKMIPADHGVAAIPPVQEVLELLEQVGGVRHGHDVPL